MLLARSRRPGIIGTEIILALGILGLLAMLTADAVLAYRRSCDTYTFRQAAAWAAEAQLQRYRLGAAIESEPPKGVLADEIRLETRTAAGEGQWAGFLRVTVIATAKVPAGSVVTEHVSGYVPGEEQR